MPVPNRYVVLAAVLTATQLTAATSNAQTLLVIPDLSTGVIGTADSDKNNRTPWWDLDAIGEMEPAESDKFWGHAQRKILPGTSLGFGENSAASYTELGAVHSGSLRVAIGTTLSTAEEDDETPEPGEVSSDVKEGLSRFLAGGGALSITGVRPLVRNQMGLYTRGALVFVPRGWVNVSQLASAEDVGNYGGELALILLIQRYSNALKDPFLNIEVRGSWAGGSDEFYASVGHEHDRAFFYLAPIVTIALEERVNVSVSTFIASDFTTDRTLRLTFSLLNKDEPDA